MRMSPGIRDRIRRLAWRDRLLLLVIVVSSIGGIPANYFHAHQLMDGSGQYWLLLTMILWATIAGLVAWSVIRQTAQACRLRFFIQDRRCGVAGCARGHSHLSRDQRQIRPIGNRELPVERRWRFHGRTPLQSDRD